MMTFEATAALTQNRDRLDAIAEGLLEHEILDEAAVYAAAGVPFAVAVAHDAPGHERRATVAAATREWRIDHAP